MNGQTEPVFPGATLEIDLGALARNYQRLRNGLNSALCGATVKADAYGLGLDRVAPILWSEGCRHFFVATPAEGVKLRRILPDAEIHIFNGVPRGYEHVAHEHRLIPVLNTLGAVDGWADFCTARGGGGAPATLHFDSGMNRLGLSPDDVAELVAKPARATFPISCIMSHLACADVPDAAMNREQLDRFNEQAEAYIAARTKTYPALPRPMLSLANSAGVLNGPEYHFDLVRPGIALYGGNPFTDRTNPMQNVIRLRGRILQIRNLIATERVGYGATWQATGPARIATVDVGYADGYLRAFGEDRGHAVINGHKVPVVGRVSMDSHALDITALPLDACAEGADVDLLGGPVALDEAIKATGLSGYELLTLLGRRYNRVYKDSEGQPSGVS